MKMVVSGTPDAVSGDDMECDSQSLESGIEGSIKRCEALLSRVPTTIGESEAIYETSSEKLKKARAYVTLNINNLMAALEPEWNKNMGLLSMSRDMSSSPASSWQSYSLHNEGIYSTDNDEGEGTRFRTSNGRRINKSQSTDWPAVGIRCSCQFSEAASENRASSDGGDSAESAVTDSLSKERQNRHKLQELDSFFLTELGHGQEESSGGDEKRSPPPREINVTVPKRSQNMLGEDANSSVEGKQSSCSSSASEPTVMEPETLTSQANKNAAESKPTGLPTNYRKADAISQKEWNCSFKFVEPNCKQKVKPSRRHTMKDTMATVERLSTPKTVAAIRELQSTPEVKRNEVPMKKSKMHLQIPKTIAVQRMYHVNQSRSSPDSKTTSEYSSKAKGGKKTEAGYNCFSPFVDRLGDVQERINSSKRAKKIREKEERDMCSFRPNINSSKHFDMERYQPIEKRLDCIREQKEKMLKKVQEQEAKDQGVTFKPELNPNSARILKKRAKSPLTLDMKDDSGNTSPQNSSNCYTDVSDPRAKASEPSKAAIVCTFVPEINANTDQILAGTPLEGCDFLTRQQQFHNRVEQRKRLKQQELASEMTFQPERGNANSILRYSPLFRIDENKSEMCERLSNADNHHRHFIQKQIHDNYYSQFTFHPQIDETSRLVGRPPSIETLHSDQRAKQHKDRMRVLAQEEFKRTCTFRPELSTSSFLADEALLEQRKRMKLERQKQDYNERVMKEIEELQECTFTPTINPWPPKVDVEPSGHQIKGVQRHLELQRLAKQMKIEQEKWEKKVFFLHQQNNDRPKQQYTIPKPFKLHTWSCSNHCSGAPANRHSKMAPLTPVHPHLCT